MNFKNNHNNKSQIKFGETIGVIIIVYIIIMVGLIWYNNINSKDLNEIYERDLNARSFEKYQFIVNLNLIHKSERGDIDEEFDMDSLIAMENFFRTDIGKEYLSKRLSFSTISVDVYNRDSFNEIRSDNIERTITLYDVQPNENIEILSIPVYRTLIPIRDNIENVNKIGIITIKSYITSSKIS